MNSRIVDEKTFIALCKTNNFFDKNLTLRVFLGKDNFSSYKVSKNLKKVIKQENFPQQLTIKGLIHPLPILDISMKGFAAFSVAMLLAIPTGSLSLVYFNWVQHGKSLVNMLQAIKGAKQKITLDLSGIFVSEKTTKAFFKELGKGGYPNGLTINLSNTNTTDAAFIALIKELTKGKYPNGIKINLNNNPITDIGIIAVSEQLKRFHS